VLLALDNMGVNITGLVAGLGIGGIAVALALQNILGDLFASLSIILDKPFVIGDFIVVDQLMGTVEHVGLKTTRIRSLSGEQVIFSNAGLLQSRIRNFKRMAERRVVFTVGVTYQTPYEKLARISALLREAVELQQGVRFDRAHFKEYGDFALVYEIVYFVTSPDYNKYMDIQQAINFEIYRRFQQEGLEFAYPTQTLFVQGIGSGSRSVRDVRAGDRVTS
jgi:small-conductance mechanosensitive channel